MNAEPSAALVDTDILSAMMRQHPAVLQHSRQYLAKYNRMTFSIVTRFEILRGLFAKNATSQLAAFDRLCEISTILPLTDTIVLRAAKIYAELYQRGALIGDADTLIAATALEHRLVVVTNNEVHFQRVSGLQLDNWTRQ